MNTSQLLAVDGGDDPTLRLAVAVYLARYKGQSRIHTESDLRAYLDWSAQHDVIPLEAQRAHLELYLRWMQEVRHYKPSTVSRRLSVLTGFYRTCVIDGILEHSPAEHVRRPHVPPESPTLGLSHLQFEAMLTAAHQSDNSNDLALVAMLGLLGLRIFETTRADIDDLSEVHGHRVLRATAKATRSPSCDCRQPSAERSTAPSPTVTAGPSCGRAPAPGWTGTAQPAACGHWPEPVESPSCGCTPTCCATPS
jgi:integrase/recombinase XerD